MYGGSLAPACGSLSLSLSFSFFSTLSCLFLPLSMALSILFSLLSLTLLFPFYSMSLSLSLSLSLLCPRIPTAECHWHAADLPDGRERQPASRAPPRGPDLRAWSPRQLRH